VLSQVVELIENRDNFGITTHIKPDGDGVGSSLGLYWLLRSLGKNAEVIVHGDVPPAYRDSFLARNAVNRELLLRAMRADIRAPR